MEVPQWRSLVSLHVYISVLLTCHFRCTFVHSLLCIVQVLFIFLIFLGLYLELEPQSQLYDGVCIFVAVVIANLVRLFINFGFMYHRFPVANVERAKKKSLMLSATHMRRNKHLVAERSELKSYIRKGSSKEDGVPQYALDHLDHVEFDDTSAHDREKRGKVLQIVRGASPVPVDTSPRTAGKSDDPISFMMEDAEFQDMGDGDDFAFVGLFRPNNRSPAAATLTDADDVTSTKNAALASKQRLHFAELNTSAAFDEKDANSTMFMFGHLAGKLDPTEPVESQQRRRGKSPADGEDGAEAKLHKLWADDDSVAADAAYLRTHDEAVEVATKESPKSRSSAATLGSRVDLDAPLLVRIETYFVPMIIVCFVLLFFVILGIFFLSEKMQQQGLCIDFATHLLVAVAADFLVANPAFMALTLMFRYMVSSETDYLYSELHPYNREVRGYWGTDVDGTKLTFVQFHQSEGRWF